LVQHEAPPLPNWLARELPFKRTLYELGEHRCHVMECGEGRPVLLLHGNPTWGYLWRKVAAELKGEPLRLIMPDLIGLGYSSRCAPQEHSLANHGRWIGALIDQLELEDLIFVGQDWGGPIGLRALVERSERLAGLVILNTIVGPPKPGFKATAFHRFARLPVLSSLVFRLFGFPQVALHTAQGDPQSIRGEVARAYREPLRGLSRNSSPLALARMVPDNMEHVSIPELRLTEQLVREFEGPSAIVWGRRDPVLGRALNHIKRLMPKADVWETEAGHFLQEEVPVEIAAGIRRVAEQLASPA